MAGRAFGADAVGLPPTLTLIGVRATSLLAVAVPEGPLTADHAAAAADPAVTLVGGDAKYPPTRPALLLRWEDIALGVSTSLSLLGLEWLWADAC